MRIVPAVCVATILALTAPSAAAQAADRSAGTQAEVTTTQYWLYCAMPYLVTGFGPLVQCTQVGAARTTARIVAYSPLTGQFSAQTDWLNIVDTATWLTGNRNSSDNSGQGVATGYAALETPFGPGVWSTQYRNGISEGRWGIVNLITGLFYPSGNGAWLPTVPPSSGPANHVSTGGMAIRQTGAAPATTNILQSLQVNLCSGGTDATVPDCGVDGAVNETRALIGEVRPELVTLNESCEPDVINRLFPAMLDQQPDEWQFWTFTPAVNRPTQRAVMCEDGNDNPVRGRFGNAMLGRLFAPLAGGPHFRYGGLLFPDNTTSPNELQDPQQSEMRSWLCVDVNHRHWGCTTHLDNRSGLGEGTVEERRVAFNQCNYLTKAVIPFIQAAEGSHPTVLAGDLNLVFDPGAKYDVQKCVPSGWFRKGDSDLQHTMATNDFGFLRSDAVELDGSDHPAWIVELIRPAG